MARHEAEREDLVKEATAYVLRGEFAIPEWEHPIFIGFRKTGAFSFYFGSDPVYQFDAQGRLRRAFIADRLYRSEGTALCSMERQRSETETVLKRTDLPAQQCQFFQWGMHEAIRQLEAAVKSSRYKVRDVVGEEELWIKSIQEACLLVLGSKEFLSPKLVQRD
ncbi:MAG: hypothetical protein JKY95_01065 [Planctomycetaceae bacterium]|nr:hypothetical protein [Planctomycetaceae bacterium]